MKLTRFAIFTCFTCACIAILASGVGPAAAATAFSFASLVPLGAVLPSPGVLHDVHRDHLRTLPSTPLMKPFEGRPAMTRDTEAKAVRDSLRPINPIA